jgi:hypothetical protein
LIGANVSVVYDFTHLNSDDELPDRPFTDLRFNYEDSWAMNLMSHRLRDLVNDPDGLPDEPRPLIIERTESDGRYLRAVICSTHRQLLGNDITVVGFFGQRRLHSGRTDVTSVDEKLVRELSFFAPAVAYLSMQLDDKDYGNLVLLRSDSARETWRESATHQYAVTELAPAFYATVRLHNGLLPGGILRDDPRVQLTSTKYFDFQQELWCGLRKF